MYFFSKKWTSVLNLSNLQWNHQPECFLVWEELIFFVYKTPSFFIGKEKKVYFLSTFPGWMISCVCCRLVFAFVPTKKKNLSQILSRELVRITELCSIFTSWTENKLWPPFSRSRSFTPVQRTACHLKHIIVLVIAFSSKRILMSFKLGIFWVFFLIFPFFSLQWLLTVSQ